MKKVFSKILKLLLSFVGFKGYSSTLMLKALKKDIINKDIPFRSKIWAWRRGFLGTRVFTYGINESNYKNHMPDFDYFKLHPINGKYSKWIDDKLTMKYILAPFNEFLPKYYFQIDDGMILKLMDLPEGINANIEGIIQLLMTEGNLAVKRLGGSLGEGFYRLTYNNGDFYINTNKACIQQVVELLSNLRGYLVTEYIIAHKDIRKVYDVTPNTLRVLVIKDRGKKAQITGGFMRFGTKESGLLEITDAGTIFTAVDYEIGCTFNANRMLNNHLENLKTHPDTYEQLEIKLPYWEEIKKIVYEITAYVPQLSYLGFDIIITDDGFKIIEINSLSALTFLAYYNPFFENEYSKEFFKRKFEEKPRKFKRVLKMMES